MKIAKFGGSSLADAFQIKKVCDIILSDADRRIVVVSTPGKRSQDDIKVTDLLIAVAKAALSGESYENELQAVIESWKANSSEFKEMGIRARKVLDSMSGASRRTIEALQKLGFLPKCQM